jgi:hypothetical protein
MLCCVGGCIPTDVDIDCEIVVGCDTVVDREAPGTDVWERSLTSDRKPGSRIFQS